MRARPCNKAVTVMNAQLQAQDAIDKAKVAGEGGRGGDGEDAASARRRRLASFFVTSDSSAGMGSVEAPEVIVAVRKRNIVGTAFHPELTNDSRWHQYFLNVVKQAMGSGGDAATPAPLPAAGLETVGATSVVA